MLAQSSVTATYARNSLQWLVLADCVPSARLPLVGSVSLVSSSSSLSSVVVAVYLQLGSLQWAACIFSEQFPFTLFSSSGSVPSATPSSGQPVLLVSSSPSDSAVTPSHAQLAGVGGEPSPIPSSTNSLVLALILFSWRGHQCVTCLYIANKSG